MAEIEPPARPGWRRIGSFGVVSGIGWGLDFLVFTVLTELGSPVAAANLVSAGIAVSFVYLRSVRHVFRCAGYRWGEFVIYAAYQVAAVAIASLAIAALAQALAIAPLLAKVLVTPMTFAANYLFMAALLARRTPAETP